MKKLISAGTHGLIDYATVAKLFLLPRALGFSKPLVRAIDGMALAKLVLNALSAHRYAAARVIPMKAHLAVDVASGASMAALPFVVGEEDPAAIATCALLGGMEIAKAAVTETEDGALNLKGRPRRIVRQLQALSAQ